MSLVGEYRDMNTALLRPDGEQGRNSNEPQPAPAQGPRPIVLPLLALLLLTLVTQLSLIAYNNIRTPGTPPLLSVITTGTVILCILTLPLAGLGLRLGGPLGLGAPLLTDLLARRQGAGDRLRRDATLAVPLGFGVGVILVLIRMATEQYLPPSLLAFGERGVLFGLLGSAGAAVGEEVWFRLGVMTILIWFFGRLLGHTVVRPSVAWSANLFAALAFGLIHLPNLAQSGAFTSTAIAATMIGNGIVGLVYGWLYWRRSLIAAMLGHFAVDLILHVLPAIGA